MTWTYDGDPSGDRKDEVRFMVGDTTQTTPLVQDEEISYILTMYPPDVNKPAWLAAAHTCDAIAGRLARQVQRSLGGALSASNQQQFEHYVALAAQFRALYATNGRATTGLGSVRAAAPVLGGGGPTLLGGSTYQNWDDGRGN